MIQVFTSYLKFISLEQNDDYVNLFAQWKTHWTFEWRDNNFKSPCEYQQHNPVTFNWGVLNNTKHTSLISL